MDFNKTAETGASCQICGSGAMSADGEPIGCDFCMPGQVVKRMEEMAFRQWSDKGYVHCRATILIGICDNCGDRSLDTTAEKILEEAFQREYDKLP
jgi:hypothetical protein